jgi:hypothetical protein
MSTESVRCVRTRPVRTGEARMKRAQNANIGVQLPTPLKSRAKLG